MAKILKSLYARASDAWPVNVVTPVLFEQGVLIFEWCNQTFMIERHYHPEGKHQGYLIWVTLSTGAYQSTIVNSFDALLTVTPFDLTRFRFASNEVCQAYEREVMEAQENIIETTGDIYAASMKVLQGKKLND